MISKTMSKPVVNVNAFNTEIEASQHKTFECMNSKLHVNLNGVFFFLRSILSNKSSHRNNFMELTIRRMPETHRFSCETHSGI